MTERISRRRFLQNSAVVASVAIVFSRPNGAAFATGQTPDRGKIIGQKRIYPDRWVQVQRSYHSDKDLEAFSEIARTAAQHGLTGVVLTGMDRISLCTPAELERLRKVKAIADLNHLEVIPQGFDTGYGAPILEFDKNLAEGLPVKDALFVANGGTASFVADSPTKLVNSNLEHFQDNTFGGFTTQTDPGIKTFVDTSVSHSGKASLRIENFGKTESARIAQSIRVRPYRCYRVSAWVKTEDAQPLSLFNIKSFTPDGRNLSPQNLPVSAATSDWRQVSTAFNSWYADRIEVNFGVFEGVKGKIWVDDLQVEEVGLMNVVRRDGAPLTVRDESTGTLYEEGHDFAPVSDPNLDFYWNHSMPSIQLLAGGRIREGARLRVSYYHGTTIHYDQVCVCPSEAKVQEFWKLQFPLIEQYLSPKCYFLNIDEVRVLNRDASCQHRHVSAAAILGDTARWLYDQVHAINPTAQVVVWSDMFDPYHNARKKYFLVDGSLENSWRYLPRHMGIVCWYFKMRQHSLAFFSGHGFKTIAAAYYDGDDLKENVAGWLTGLDATSGAQGIMYTTWEDKYKLLAPFGDMVSRRNQTTATPEVD